MGAGHSPAGGAPAGSDPAVLTGGPREVFYPRAIQYHAQQTGFPIDANGRYFDVHPVDQRVALKLSVELGKIASNPETGHRLRDIRYTTEASVGAAVEDFVRLALADELSAREIQILSIDHETPTTSAIAVAVRYMNLVTLQEQIARASANT